VILNPKINGHKIFLGNIILVAHKCLDYDAKVLLRNLEEFEIPYEDIIMGFSDSLLASR
jgi:hypothetical protein